VAKGSVKKHGHFVLGLCNAAVGTVEESVWSLGGIQSYSTSPVEMFLSSSSASDTAKIIAVSGINEALELETRLYVINGQSAVTAGIWFRVLQIRNAGGIAGGGDLAGSLYIAEADTLVAGVPSTPTKIRAAIIFDTAANRSPNVGLTAGFTVPVNHFALITSIKFAAPNAKDVVFSTLLRPNDDTGTIIRPFQDAAPFNLFQTESSLDFDGIFVDQLWDVEVRARTASGTSAFCTVIMEFILIERD
jgi:hypothetical protein